MAHLNNHLVDPALFEGDQSNNNNNNTNTTTTSAPAMLPIRPQSTQYPELRASAATMTIVPTPTTREHEIVHALIPRNAEGVAEFYQRRTHLTQNLHLEPLGQLNAIIGFMLQELGAADNFDINNIQERYDALIRLLIQTWRSWYPKAADIFQKEAAAIIAANGASATNSVNLPSAIIAANEATAAADAVAASLVFPPPPPSPDTQRSIAFVGGAWDPSKYTKRLDAASRLRPSSARMISNNGFDGTNENDEYEEMRGVDKSLIMEYGGTRKVINKVGVAAEYLVKRRESASVACHYHPEADRLRKLPPSTGAHLSDSDILQLVRLPNYERHIRASKVYTARGEYYGAYRRFTEMSDARLRHEGLLRSWIPRVLSDRPSNSVERLARAKALGLTGDTKLEAIAALELERRRRRPVLSNTVRTEGNGVVEEGGVSWSARPQLATKTLDMAPVSYIQGAEVSLGGTRGLTRPAFSSETMYGAENSGVATGDGIVWETGYDGSQDVQGYSLGRGNSDLSVFSRRGLSSIAEHEGEEQAKDHAGPAIKMEEQAKDHAGPAIKMEKLSERRDGERQRKRRRRD